MQGPTPISTQTDATGQYALAGLGQTNLQIEPTMRGVLGGSITALDATVALQAAVGQTTLDAQQQLACDVNGDGVVTAFDAVLILQYASGLISAFPVAQSCGSDFAFVPIPGPASNQQLIQPVVGSVSCQPGAIVFGPLAGTASGQDFSAVLFGDCRANTQPTVVAP